MLDFSEGQSSDLHDELLRSWEKTYSSRSQIILRICEDALGRRGACKQPLPNLTSQLVGKAYTVAGQAGGALHTMAVLQAYQADLLKDLDGGEGLAPEAATP